MTSECIRIADQVRRAFAGDAWHGPPLSEILKGVDFEQAFAKPLPPAHSIWELVLHIDVYLDVALAAVRGISMPQLYGTEGDWPAVTDRTAEAWGQAVDRLLSDGERLAAAIEQFGDARLPEIAPGREYDFYILFHGLVQHSLYHGGQIAMLKRLLAG
jgi:hypothetical protein